MVHNVSLNHILVFSKYTLIYEFHTVSLLLLMISAMGIFIFNNLIFEKNCNIFHEIIFICSFLSLFIVTFTTSLKFEHIIRTDLITQN